MTVSLALHDREARCLAMRILLFTVLAVGAHAHDDHGSAAPSALASLLSVGHVGSELTALGKSTLPVAQVVPFSVAQVSLAPDSVFGQAQRRNHDYLLALNNSQLLCIFTSAANLTRCTASDCPSPGGGGNTPLCDPLPGEMGLGAYYGHYLGHYLSAAAMLAANTGDSRIKEKGAAIVRTLGDCQSAWARRYPSDCSVEGLDGDGYLFPYDPIVFRKLEDLTLHAPGQPRMYSVPFYTLHKLMAGLLDQYQLVGNTMAFAMVRRMADWVVRNVAKASAAKDAAGNLIWQEVLNTEWGGMNEIMFNLYGVTKNESYLHAGRLFNHFSWSAPLAVGVDDLAGNHANTHIPEVIGNMVGYELTGNATDKAIAGEFFAAVTQNHSWATGGSNDGEHWGVARRMGDALNANTEESCTQYNLLKVTRHLLQWTANSTLGDFYDRALWSGIIGNQNQQDPDMTQFIYMLPLGGGGVRKAWGRSDQGFPCCWGTLSETFSKLSDSIFFTDTSHSALYVNLFASATLAWGEQGGITVSQRSEYPVSPSATTTITFGNVPATPGAARFTLKVRVPAWATDTEKNTVLVNAQAVDPSAIVPGTWLALHPPSGDAWTSSDAVEVHFPLTFSRAPLQDDRAEYNETTAYLYGPLVLAAVNTTEHKFAPRGNYPHDPATFITRASETELKFEAAGTVGLSGATSMTMMPLYQIMTEAYTVYFDNKPVQVVQYNKAGAVVPSGVDDLGVDGSATILMGHPDDAELCYPGNGQCDNVRTGNPGDKVNVVLQHPIAGAGHAIDSVEMSFRYVTGYTPAAGENATAPVLSVVVLNAESMRPVKTVYTSPPLDKYSFDHFSQYSPPLRVSATGLAIPNDRPLVIALQICNNQRNLQIPIDKTGFNITVHWVGSTGSKSTGKADEAQQQEIGAVTGAGHSPSVGTMHEGKFTHGEGEWWSWSR